MSYRWNKDDLEPLSGSERERQRWGNTPTIAKEALAEYANPGRPPFPFESWAREARFQVPEGSAPFFCRCASAAEAFFIRPFIARGVVFSEDRAVKDRTELAVAVPCRRYFIDAVVTTGTFRLAIEIDGLAYHHRSRQQIAADYLRERRLVLAGYTVIRLTAPEVFASPEECWRQIDAILETR